MQIKQLASATGVDIETIRFYEKQGLLPEPARKENGYRDYDTTHLERLSFIRHCRALEMPLSQVAVLLGFVDQPGVGCGDVNLLVDQQLAQIHHALLFGGEQIVVHVDVIDTELVAQVLHVIVGILRRIGLVQALKHGAVAERTGIGATT